MSESDRNPAEDRSSPEAARGAAKDGLPAHCPLCCGETRPEIIARLEWLDDLMFAAIDGDAAALEAATEAWREALVELGAEVVEESRRQYLRCAHGVWHALRFEPEHPPEKIFAAIEVISLLSGRQR
jgi:hypothetical protein